MPCFSDAYSKQLGQHVVGSGVSLGDTRASLLTASLLKSVVLGVIDKWKAPASGQPLSPVLVLLSTENPPEDSLSLLLSFVP